MSTMDDPFNLGAATVALAKIKKSRHKKRYGKHPEIEAEPYALVRSGGSVLDDAQTPHRSDDSGEGASFGGFCASDAARDSVISCIGHCIRIKSELVAKVDEFFAKRRYPRSSRNQHSIFSSCEGHAARAYDVADLGMSLVFGEPTEAVMNNDSLVDSLTDDYGDMSGNESIISLAPMTIPHLHDRSGNDSIASFNATRTPSQYDESGNESIVSPEHATKSRRENRNYPSFPASQEPDSEPEPEVFLIPIPLEYKQEEYQFHAKSASTEGRDDPETDIATVGSDAVNLADSSLTDTGRTPAVTSSGSDESDFQFDALQPAKELTRSEESSLKDNERTLKKVQSANASDGKLAFPGYSQVDDPLFPSLMDETSSQGTSIGASATSERNAVSMLAVKSSSNVEECIDLSHVHNRSFVEHIDLTMMCDDVD